jgi:hypothetical protein
LHLGVDEVEHLALTIRERAIEASARRAGGLNVLAGFGGHAADRNTIRRS